MGFPFKCGICGAMRPDCAIAVQKYDSSEDYGLPQGTITEHLNYCVDQLSCCEKAAQFRGHGKRAAGKETSDGGLGTAS